MPYNKPVLVPNPMTPNTCITVDENLCNGCNKCIKYCRRDCLMPNPVRGKPPILVYPDECWFCGCCADICPKGAAKMEHPLNQRVAWKRKETGEIFRPGLKIHPVPNTRPVVGD